MVKRIIERWKWNLWAFHVGPVAAADILMVAIYRGGKYLDFERHVS